MLMIPRLGLQNDEALFGEAIYPTPGLIPTLSLGTAHIPLMLMSYLGALKGWIYTPVFEIWTPTVYSIRVPMLLAGMATIWLFFLLLRRWAGGLAAVVGALLLATDPTYLLTMIFDWGPVALQHVLLLGGLCLLARYYYRERWWELAGGSFLLGLALWDKALFLWILGGLAAGTLAAYPRQLFRSITPGRIAISFAFFCLGATPLIVYNAGADLMTVRANSRYVWTELAPKFRFLVGSLEGGGLFGWMVRHDVEVAHPAAPQTATERAAVWLGDAARHPQSTLLVPALVVALLIWPFVWRGARKQGRIMLFAVVSMGVAWVEMAVTWNAGASLHHTVLLWPLPQVIVAVAAGWVLQRAWDKRLVLVGLAVVILGNVLVVNQYYAQAIRNGGGLNWTDAIFPLADYMKTVKAEWIVATDWGIVESLRLLDTGRLPLASAVDPLSKPALTEAETERVRQWVAQPQYVYVGHTEGNEFFAGARAHLMAIAGAARLRKEVLAVIPDRFGKPMFEVFRFRPAL